MSPNIILLEARLRKELFQLDNLENELKALAKIKELKVESVRLRAYASILHDFYSGIEKMFINIAREIDEAVPKAEGWHRQLLEQMTLDIPSKRPAVVDVNLAAQLQQYLSFRHRFRNLYGFELDWARMEGLVKNMGATLKNVKNSIEDLLVILQSVI
ncbi:hypothetical protein L9W92_01635 [Pelotomaculum terephthalicicum JT]|uniref:ribonuclease toxin HepT-like protein n=1 Tax=Pelotomaculum terephthalicicum TaxID=206393 RepID=UPI001F03ACAB|nr:hypothetical protein [Pelotomaculum terephthalicicum]MCG9966759.1 hypothetical protein [Pelotomaculum terephthalicicum JT]